MVIMKLGLHIIKNSNDTFSFVGNVPLELGFIKQDGTTPTQLEVTNDLMLPSSYRSLKTRVFQTEEAALLAQEKFYFPDSLKE